MNYPNQCFIKNFIGGECLREFRPLKIQTTNKNLKILMVGNLGWGYVGKSGKNRTEFFYLSKPPKNQLINNVSIT